MERLPRTRHNRHVETILLVSPYWKEPHRWMVSSLKLAELWQRLGYRVVVACMGDSAGMERVSPTLTIYRRRDVFLKDPWNYGIALGFGGFVAKIAKQEKPDHIVINKVLFWTSLSMLGLTLRSYRVTLLTDALVGITWWPRSVVAKACAAIYAWTLGWLVLLCADRIIFFHPQPEAILRRLRVSKKSSVIPTGIDPSPYLQPGIRNLPSQCTVTYIGRLESVKGVDDFLAALTPLVAQYPSLNLQVVGYYQDGHPLVERYHGTVRFTGLRDDVPQILASTDIFVMPSHSEGLSNALMEAMASGCACVASDVGGNAFLLQNGVSGLLYPAGDRSALQSHVRRLLDDAAKRQMLGQAARERIVSAFSWDIVGKQYRDLFRSAIS